MSVLSAAVLADSPAMYFRLAETGAGPFIDAVSANNATPNGTIVTAPSLLPVDKADAYGVNAAAKFDWATGTLQQAFTSVPIGGSGAMTVECWANFDDFVKDPSAAGYYASVNALLFIGSGGSGGADGWLLGVRTDGTLYWARHGFGDASITTDALAAGVTYHIVAVLNAAQTSMDVYINGVFSKTTAVPSGAAALGGVALNNGAATVNTNPRCRVTLQHVAIYTSALSAADIATHYAAGQVPVTPARRSFTRRT